MQNLHGTACCKTIFEPAASYRQLHSYLTVSHQESYLELKTSAISAEMNPKYLTFSEANKAEPRCTEQSTDSCNITSGLSTFLELANTTDLALKSIEDCITSFDPLNTELSVQTSKGVPPMESILSPIRTSKMSILEALWRECATAPKLVSATPKQKPQGKSSLPWRGKDHRLEPFKDMVHESANKKELFASLHSLRICTNLCLDSVGSMDGPNSSNSISSLELWSGVQPFNCSLPSAADTAQLSGDQVTDNAGTDPSDVETWVSDDLAIARFEKDRKSRLEKQSALQLLALNENKCMRSGTLAKREDKNDKVKLPSVLCCPNVAVRNYESSKINSASRGMAKEPPSCSSSSFSVDCLRSDQSDLNINDSSLVRHSEYLNFDNLEHSSKDSWGFLDSEAENLSLAGNSDYDDSSAGSPFEEDMEWVFGADAIEMFDNDARFMFPGKDCSDNLSPESEHLSEIHDSGSICMSDQESRESRLFTERSHIMTGESLKLELGNFFGNQELVESPRLGCNRWSADLKYVKAEIEAATLPKTTENMLEALPEYLTPRGIVNDNHVGKGVKNSLHVALGHDFIPTSSTFMLCNGHGNFYLFNKGNSTLHLCINVEGSNVSLPELFSDSDGTYGSDRQHYIVAECFQLVLPETMALLPSFASIVLEPGSRIQIQVRAGPQWGQEQEQANAARNSILSGVITIREACMNERSEMSLLESVPVSIFQTQRTDILLNGISPPLRDLSKECILSPGNGSLPLCFENHGKHKAVVFVSIDSEASPRQFVLQHGERQAVSLNISKQKQFVQIIYMELDCWKVQMATLNYFAELFNTLKCDQNGSHKERLARLFVSCHRAMTKVKTYYFAGILSSGEGGHPGTLKFLNDKLLTPNLSGVEHAYEPDKLNYLPKTPQSQNSKYSGLESNHTSDFIHWLLKVLVSCSGLQEETERLCQKVHLSSTESDSYFMSSSKFHVRSLQLTNEIGNILVENFLKFVASDRKEIAKRAPAMDWFFQTKFRCSTPAKPLHITTDTAPSNDIYSSEHEDPNPSSRSRRSLAISRLSLDSKAFSEAQSSNEVDVDFLVLDDSWKGVGTRGSVNRQQDPIIQEPCWVLNNASAGIKEQRKIVYEHLQANASNIKRLNAQENIESSKTPRKRIVDELIFDRYENRARLISNDNEDNESDCNLTWAPRTPQSMEHEQGNPSFEETVVDELVFDSCENHARLTSNDNEDNESDFNSTWTPRTPQSMEHEQGNPGFEETLVDELVFDSYENHARLISNDNEDNESDFNSTWTPRTPQSMEHEQGNPGFEETVVDELVFDSYENHARLISNDNEDNESDFNSPWAPRTPQSTKHEQGNPSFEETLVDELVFDSYENHARLISNDNEDNESDFNSTWTPRTPQSMEHEQGNPGFEETVVDELVFDSYENHARLISNDNEDSESDFNSPWTPRTPQSMEHEQGNPGFEETVVDELVFDSYENHARLISNDNEDNESDFNSPWAPRTPQSTKHEQGNPSFEETVVDELVFDSYENHARLISNDNEDNESDFNSPWAPRTPQSMKHEQGNPGFEETVVDELVFDSYENHARLISNDNEDNESDFNSPWTPRTPQSMKHEQGDPSFEETVVDELVFDSYENHARLISNDNEDNESDFNSTWTPRTPQSMKHEQGNPGFEETVVNELVFDSYENHARLISNDNEDNESDFNSPWAPRTPQSMEHEQGNPSFEETGDVLPSSDTTPKFYEEDQNYIEELANTSAQYGGKAVSNFGLLKSPQVNMYKPYHRRVCPKSSLEQHSEHARPAAPVVLSKISLQTSTKLSKGMVLFQRSIDHIVVSSTLADGLEKSNELQSRASFGRPKKESFACAKTPGYAENVDPGQRTELFGSHLQRQSSGEFSQSVDNVKMVSSYRDLYIAIKNAGKFLYDEGLSVHHLARARDYSMKANNIASSA